MKKIKNFTPHDVNIVGEDGRVIKTLPSEGLVRLSQSTERVSTLTVEGADIPLTKTVFGEAQGLPPQKEDTIYIVSSLVCQAYPGRQDFYIPDQTVRDNNGRIIGCRSLSQNPFGSGNSGVGQ